MLFALAYWGEILALSCSVVWALAVILFKKTGETVPPLGLNLFKNIFALVLFIPTLLLLGQTFIVNAPFGHYFLLLASGVMGIGLADTLFFRSLNLIGAEFSAIADCTYSPFIIGLSVLFLRERISGLQLLGVLLILSAILAISRQKGTKNISRQDLVVGILLGILSMALMAIGIVMIKPLLSQYSLLWVITIRLLAGCLTLSLMISFRSDRQKIMHSILYTKDWHFMLLGSFLGAYLALIVWMGGMKYTQVSIASALNQTSNIFIFILAAIFLKEPITRLRIIGIILAFGGAVMVSLG